MTQKYCLASTGTPIVLDKWNDGEPNNHNGDEDKLVLLYQSGSMGYVDMKGSLKLRFVCEYENGR